MNNNNNITSHISYINFGARTINTDIPDTQPQSSEYFCIDVPEDQMQKSLVKNKNIKTFKELLDMFSIEFKQDMLEKESEVHMILIILDLLNMGPDQKERVNIIDIAKNNANKITLNQAFEMIAPMKEFSNQNVKGLILSFLATGTNMGLMSALMTKLFDGIIKQTTNSPMKIFTLSLFGQLGAATGGSAVGLALILYSVLSKKEFFNFTKEQTRELGIFLIIGPIAGQLGAACGTTVAWAINANINIFNVFKNIFSESNINDLLSFLGNIFGQFMGMQGIATGNRQEKYPNFTAEQKNQLNGLAGAGFPLVVRGLTQAFMSLMQLNQNPAYINNLIMTAISIPVNLFYSLLLNANRINKNIFNNWSNESKVIQEEINKNTQDLLRSEITRFIDNLFNNATTSNNSNNHDDNNRSVSINLEQEQYETTPHNENLENDNANFTTINLEKSDADDGTASNNSNNLNYPERIMNI